MNEVTIGIFLSFGALLSWGFGDFFIQRTTRLIGTWKALLYITGFGAVALFPFVRSDLQALTVRDFSLLWLVTVITLFAALFDFEALKRGKIAIVEPIMGIELPLTAGLSILLWKENVSALQILLIITTFTGITLAITHNHSHLRYHRRIFEKGVVFAGLGAVTMALANFTTGIASQTTSPFLTIWFVHTGLAGFCMIYLASQGNLRDLLTDLRSHLSPIAAQSILDNAAWLFYSSAMIYLPIAIATTISESYIVLASLLGIVVNREKLRGHQYIGIVLTIISIILLSAVTGL